MPDDWQYPKASLGCADQWCPNGFRTGTEVLQLDPTMTQWAFRLSQNVQLQDDPKARAYAQHYPEDVARGAPFVTSCAILGVNDFIHGTLMSEWSAWWVSQWTKGQSEYCMSADEEGGIFTALQRLAEADRVDMRRVMVLRVATDIDRQYPGQTAGESLADSLDSTFGFAGLENVYRAGSPVVREIVNNWERWRDGPPPLSS
jgi:purine nucleoside permease